VKIGKLIFLIDVAKEGLPSELRAIYSTVLHYFLTSFQKKKDYKQNVLRNCTVPPHLQIKGRLN